MTKDVYIDNIFFDSPLSIGDTIEVLSDSKIISLEVSNFVDKNGICCYEDMAVLICKQSDEWWCIDMSDFEYSPITIN